MMRHAPGIQHKYGGILQNLEFGDLDQCFGLAEQHVMSRYTSRNIPSHTVNTDDEPRYHPRLPLRTLFHKFGNLICADPRDRVYALLGVAEGRLEVDYSKSAGATFLDAVVPLMHDYSAVRLQGFEIYDKLATSMGVDERVLTAARRIAEAENPKEHADAIKAIEML